MIATASLNPETFTGTLHSALTPSPIAEPPQHITEPVLSSAQVNV